MNVVQPFAFRGPRRRAADTVHIGLVNNMPDAALRATELQFARLLKDAAGLVDVRLYFFSFGEIERSEQARARMDGTYADAAAIPRAGLDALIVTGAEPREADMRSEPYWESFAALTDWAKTNTISTIFSCLAAHAAVLHLDGIERRPFAQKLSGVFPCHPADDSMLTFNIAANSAVPHSRYNDLPPEEIADAGYTIHSRLAGGGVNLFSRKAPSLFVFLQGHPEYDETSLGREYLRDIGRYLNAERHERPAMPENYFDAAATAALSEARLGVRNPALLPRFTEIVNASVPAQSWRGDAVKLFGNWLTLVGSEKARRRVEAAKGVPLARLRRA
ncbi:MAG TPA: homoserine O-succinyltransferase [Rhizomicrobium sp.]|nr:homoserine O-succinyltransferase [Rhizomicrobium sp.]